MTINTARKILGITSKHMSDKDIDLLLSNFYGLAEVIAEIVINNGSNRKPEVIDYPQERINNESS